MFQFKDENNYITYHDLCTEVGRLGMFNVGLEMPQTPTGRREIRDECKAVTVKDGVVYTFGRVTTAIISQPDRLFLTISNGHLWEVVWR